MNAPALSSSASTKTIFDQIVRQSTVDPEWFCVNVLRSPNDIWQTECMQVISDLDRVRLGLEPIFNVDQRNRITVRAFHGPGKTHWLAKMMHWWNFTRKGKIICTAPKEDQVKTRVWPEFRKILANAIPEYKKLIQPTRTMVTWLDDPDWVALIESAATPENLAGHHDDWLLYLVEEASGVDEAMFPAIEGALSTPSAVLGLIGNPTRTTGEFHASHCKRGTKELYYQKAIRHDESTRISAKWVKDMIDKYGEDSPVVQVRVFGNFVDMEERQLLSLEWLEDAISREYIPDGSIPRFRVSVDVADGGEDSSIISEGLEYESFYYLRRQHKFNFPSSIAPVKTYEAAKRIYDAMAEEFPTSEGDMVIDAVGVGAGTAGLAMGDGVPVIAYKGGEASDDSTMWANRRTQSYICYRNDLRDGLVVISPDYCDPDDWDDFFGQHVSIKTVDNGDKREELETKKALRARGIKSPDMPDAIKQHWATQAPAIKGTNDILAEIASGVAQGDW